MLSFLKSKRGSIPIVIFVIGVFVLCGVAILSLFVSNANVKSKFNGLELVEIVNNKVDTFYLYRNSGVSDDSAAALLSGEIKGGFLVLEETYGGVTVVLERQI